MFENPILMEMLIKQRQEELLLENQKMLRIREIMRMHQAAGWARPPAVSWARPLMTTRINDVMLLLAELLIKAGTNLRRRCSIDGDASMDRLASSLSSK